jgi:hypothetical protein
MSSAQLAAHRAVMKKKNNRLSKKKAAIRSRVAAMPVSYTHLRAHET